MSAAARLCAWADQLRQARADDAAVSAAITERAQRFTGESLGLEGSLVARFLQRTPALLPVKRWGGDLGWPSEKRLTSWKRLLERQGISNVPANLGMLLRLETVASAWLPHPDAPANWAVADLSAFQRYVVTDFADDISAAEEAFALALQWRAENAIALHERLTPLFHETDIEFSARYHAYGGAQYIDLALVVPTNDAERLRIRSVWRSEAALAELLRAAYPDVIRQYTAQWLGSQRIDVYIPSQRLAFEYHGLQHYSSVAYFGGEAQLRETQARDQRKRAACLAAGVRLVEWPYTRRIDSDVLRSTLAAIGVRMPASAEE